MSARTAWHQGFLFRAFILDICYLQCGKQAQDAVI